MRIAVQLAAIAIAVTGAAGAGAAPAELAAPSACPGRVVKGVCLRPGARCKPRDDRAFHRYRFHCHRGRLVRFPKPGISVAVTGPAQVVFDWTTQRCEDTDIPDIMARAFRAVDGRVQLLASHLVSRRLIGPDLDRLTHECRPVLDSNHDSRPDAFDDSQWISALYTEDGRTVHALLHNEYHGQEHGAARCPSLDNNLCWYDTITSAVSTDGGATFSHPLGPAHAVAPFPFRYVPDDAGMGYYGPSSIVRSPKDGYYYAFFGRAHRLYAHGACIMRTPTLADPSAWRYWTGTAWDGAFVNPYTNEVPDPVARLCPMVLDVLAESLSWNEYLGKFLLIGSKGYGTYGAFFYALSDDLVTWTALKPIMGVELTFTYGCGEPDPKAYASFIDPESPSRSFDVTGRDGWLYYTQFNYSSCRMTLDRDLARVPIRFTKVAG